MSFYIPAASLAKAEATSVKSIPNAECWQEIELCELSDAILVILGCLMVVISVPQLSLFLPNVVCGAAR